MRSLYYNIQNNNTIHSSPTHSHKHLSKKRNEDDKNTPEQYNPSNTTTYALIRPHQHSQQYDSWDDDNTIGRNTTVPMRLATILNPF